MSSPRLYRFYSVSFRSSGLKDMHKDIVLVICFLRRALRNHTVTNIFRPASYYIFFIKGPLPSLADAYYIVPTLFLFQWKLLRSSV